MHIFHPQVIHTDHSSVHYLNSRKDPNSGSINGGYLQPQVNRNPQPEFRITEQEYKKWRQEQYRKALEERKRHPDEQNQLEPDDDYDNNDSFHEPTKDETESDDDDDYKKRKVSSTSDRKELTKHANHNYNQDYEATNSDKTYANYPSREMNKKKPFRSSPPVQQTMQKPRKQSRKNKPMQYGFIRQNEAQASNVQPHYYEIEPTGDDSTYYATLPKDQNSEASEDHDEIYSGLLSARYSQKIADKSKLLADINYNRKKQTKTDTLQRRSQ